MADEVAGALATIRTYDDLHQALRARAEVLRVSRQALDDVAGLQSGYTSKLLGPVPVKMLSRMSLGALMGAMGVKLVMLVDHEAMAKVQTRIDEAFSPYAGAAMPARKPEGGRGFWRGVSTWGKTMRARQMLTQSPFVRAKIARTAAKARWAKYRAKTRSRPGNGSGGSPGNGGESA